jgi:hypothetical protein
MGVSVQPNGDGMLLTFTLLPPSKQSWFVGDLTFAAKEIFESREPAPVSTKTTSDSDPDEKLDPKLRRG